MDLANGQGTGGKTLQLGCQQKTVCWQGGEPTLMGLDFFREVVHFPGAMGKSGQIIENTLPTTEPCLTTPGPIFWQSAAPRGTQP